MPLKITIRKPHKCSENHHAVHSQVWFVCCEEYNSHNSVVLRSGRGGGGGRGGGRLFFRGGLGTAEGIHALV